jgi:hypothetical protein
MSRLSDLNSSFHVRKRRAQMNTARLIAIIGSLTLSARGDSTMERSFDAEVTTVKNAIVAAMLDKPIGIVVDNTPYSLRFAGRTHLPGKSSSSGTVYDVPALVSVWFTVVSEADKTRVAGRCTITMSDPYKPTTEAQRGYDLWLADFMERLRAKLEPTTPKPSASP